MSMNRRSQTLYRDPEDKMIGGVCSGLAHYFDIDTVLVRVAFLVIALIGGGGVLAYAILWAVLDPAPPGALGGPEEVEPPLFSDTVEPDVSLREGATDAEVQSPEVKSPEMPSTEVPPEQS